VSIPVHSMALNVTVQSYNGRLDYGLIACRRAVPDVNDLADGFLAEHRTLLDLARAQTPALSPAAVEALVAPAKPKTVAAVKPTSPAAKRPAAKRTKRALATA
jgi:diacylglycerol O-acyltransferase